MIDNLRNVLEYIHPKPYCAWEKIVLKDQGTASDNKVELQLVQACNQEYFLELPEHATKY